MIDSRDAGTARAERLSTADLRALPEDFLRADFPVEDADLVQQIEAYERIKSAAAASQAQLTSRLAASQRRDLEAIRGAGRRIPDPESSIGAQVALARHESPRDGRAHLRLADALTRDLPCTLEALAVGDISERRAQIIADETRELCAEDRRTADLELSGRLGDLGDGQLREATRRIVLRLDHEAATRRCRTARQGRHVSGRMLKDGMARVSAVIGQEQYAAVLDSLGKAATAAKAAGDERTHGQLKADTLVQRVTGLDPTQPVPVAVNLVVGTETLFGQGPEPGFMPGVGHLPAALCRDLVLRAGAAGVASLRRLFVTPDDRELVAMESRSRTFDGALGDLIDIRDGGICRTPWCDAPIRHKDHVERHADGGETSADNGQGLCESCSYVKETPGWLSWVNTAGGVPEVGQMTPLGDVHHSHPPPMPGGPRGAPVGSRLEVYVTNWLLAA